MTSRSELNRERIVSRQTQRIFVYPDPKVSRPYQPDIRLTYGDLFEMFDMPFAYGGPWTKADARPEQVIVIDDATNRRVFGGVNSVGKTLRVGEPFAVPVA